MKYNRIPFSKKEDGSFTVEAALIMPVILGIIVLFIYIVMLAHDRCTIAYICETACAKAVYEKEDPEGYAEDRIRSGLSDKLILDHDTRISVCSDKVALIAVVEADETVINGQYVYTAKAYKLFCPKY